MFARKVPYGRKFPLTPEVFALEIRSLYPMGPPPVEAPPPPQYPGHQSTWSRDLGWGGYWAWAESQGRRWYSRYQQNDWGNNGGDGACEIALSPFPNEFDTGENDRESDKETEKGAIHLARPMSRTRCPRLEPLILRLPCRLQMICR